MMVKCYPVNNGVMGYVEERGEYILFPTDREYLEYLKEENEGENKNE